MKDQASVGSESPDIKYDRALSLFTESVMKPDHDLRGCAHNQGCYDELMEIIILMCWSILRLLKKSHIIQTQMKVMRLKQQN